jgi:hypothetical protein
MLGHCSSREAGTGSPGDQGNAVFGRPVSQPADLLNGFGIYDAIREAAVLGCIDLIYNQLGRVSDELRGGYDAG